MQTKRFGGYAMTAVALVATSHVAAAAPCKVEQLAQLAVTMHGLRPVIETGINGKPAPFILDSGAFYSTISPPVAKALHLPQQPLPIGYRVGGIGGSSEAWATTVHRLTLAGQTVADVQFIVSGTDIGETGLIGQNVLGLGDAEYDLPDGSVRLFRANGCGKMAMAYWTNGKPFFELPIEPKSETNRHTVGTLELNGARIRAYFDTGASRTVLSLKAAARAGVKPGDPGVRPDGWETGLGSRVVRGWTGHFDTLKIGNEELHNVRLRFADLGALDADMLLGADYFISHRLYVSNLQHRIYFTYTGGKLFDTNARIDAAAPIVAQGAADPAVATDADGYSRRGAMYQTQRDLPHAIEAFGQAIALAPKDPRYTRQRALAYLAAKRPVLAMDDLDATLALDPTDTDARLLRAEVRLRAGNRTGAIADLDDVAARLPREDARRMRVAQLYSTADAFAPAIAQYDLWLSTHHDDAHRSIAQNGRCWAHALANTELDKARSDCDAAVRAVRDNPAFLDSRGLVALRQGDDRAAVADFTAALAINPRLAWSLYCRSLAERRLGQAADAERDVAAAIAIDKTLPERAKRYGLT